MGDQGITTPAVYGPREESGYQVPIGGDGHSGSPRFLYSPSVLRHVYNSINYTSPRDPLGHVLKEGEYLFGSTRTQTSSSSECLRLLVSLNNKE